MTLEVILQRGTRSNFYISSEHTNTEGSSYLRDLEKEREGLWFLSRESDLSLLLSLERDLEQITTPHHQSKASSGQGGSLRSFPSGVKETIQSGKNYQPEPTAHNVLSRGMQYFAEVSFCRIPPNHIWIYGWTPSQKSFTTSGLNNLMLTVSVRAAD